MALVNRRDRNLLFAPHADSKRFATDEALEEFYRVLIPGGTLGMIWNVEDCMNSPILSLSVMLMA